MFIGGFLVLAEGVSSTAPGREREFFALSKPSAPMIPFPSISDISSKVQRIHNSIYQFPHPSLSKRAIRHGGAMSLRLAAGFGKG
ncbi:hypothetical protein ACUUL3_09080 [Thiovibrio sp. JS02]